MTASPLPPQRGKPPATARILVATVDRLVAPGGLALSVQEVADAAGVSKGLVHYHFRDKDALLARAAVFMTDELIARERNAMAKLSPANGVDTLWQWLDGELALGHIRVLLELSRLDAPPVAEAARIAAERRRLSAAETVMRLFSALELTPRVPAEMLAAVHVAFVDGLAMDAVLAPERNHRVAFDVFWLAMLSLAE
jgi:AcrR family transcriptional regulator